MRPSPILLPRTTRRWFAAGSHDAIGCDRIVNCGNGASGPAADGKQDGSICAQPLWAAGAAVGCSVYDRASRSYAPMLWAGRGVPWQSQAGRATHCTSRRRTARSVAPPHHSLPM
jgi:hypothetical protein